MNSFQLSALRRQVRSLVGQGCWRAKLGYAEPDRGLRMSDFEAIDFHDAHLVHLGISPEEDQVRLSFENVSVFFPTAAAERFEVWSFTAEVVLSLPEKIVLDRRPPSDGWIIDDRLEGVAGDRLDWRACLAEPVKVRSISFTFNNGAKLIFDDSFVRLKLLEKKEFYETWEGPL